MRRREFLAAASAAGTALIAGCSESDESSDGVDRPDFESPDIDLPSPGSDDESQPDPELTEINHLDIWRPREPDVLAFIISYDDVDHSKSYSINVKVGSGDSTNEGSVEMDTILDRWYPGKTGLSVSMPNEDDYSFSVPVTVSLYEEGEEVDVGEDSVML